MNLIQIDKTRQKLCSLIVYVSSYLNLVRFVLTFYSQNLVKSSKKSMLMILSDLVTRSYKKSCMCKT